MTRPTWDQRIDRAGVLAQRHPSAAEVLAFYEQLAMEQKRLYASFQISGAELNAALIAAYFPRLLDFLARTGTAELAGRARALGAEGMDRWEGLIQGCWLGVVSDQDEFFARAFLQPYAEVAAQIPGPRSSATCPHCGHKPQVAVLREEAYGARRSLVCSLCASEWNYRRMLCPSCGENGFDELPVYTAPEFPHMRIESCETCKAYLLSVDMTKDGLAVPSVDELAAMPLNLWAQERGYNKLQPNLLGL